MTRQQVLAANWKMYKIGDEAEAFAEFFLSCLPHNTAQIIICPPATLLAEISRMFGGTRVRTAAQNIHWEREGAFTGEISAAMALDAGAAYTLIGHSERRQYFGETAATVAKKTLAALNAGLIPLVCVGETLEQRQAGQTLTVLHNDVLASLAGINPEPRLILAYEPVWAIGTGRVATPEDAEQAIAHIRATLAEVWGDTAQQVRILYGGSVKPDNIGELLAQPNIDGALVGGASLDPAAFAKIVAAGA